MSTQEQMRMTLGDFIKSPGIPADDTFYLYNPPVFANIADCASNKKFLNRRFDCGLSTRLRRRAYFEHGIGRIPIHRHALRSREVFWGCYDGDIMLRSLLSLFSRLSRRADQEYVVIVGATDDSFTEKYTASIPSSVARVFVLNCDVEHPKVSWYPLGRNNKAAHCFEMPPKADKQHLVYCNFSPDTHPVRKRTLEILRDKAFVNRVDVSGYGHYVGYPLSNEEFLAQLNDHAFCICPRGAGFDTYRIWDCLHLGVVPIVVREAAFHHHLKALPVLFIDSVEDYSDLTESFLKLKYSKMLKTRYDFGLLTAGYWKQRFSDSA